jgi:hypothetical protein
MLRTQIVFFGVFLLTRASAPPAGHVVVAGKEELATEAMDYEDLDMQVG